MPRLIEAPVEVAAVGDPPKTISEFIGQASDGEDALSVAQMKTPIWVGGASC